MNDVRTRGVDRETIEDADPEDIAKRTDVDPATVESVVAALAEFEAERNPWRDPDRLHRLYYREGLRQDEIADRLGCGQRTVSRWMDYFEMSPGKSRSNMAVDIPTLATDGGDR